MTHVFVGSEGPLLRTCAVVRDTYSRLGRRTGVPRLETRVAAVLVWCLSSCPSLAVLYLQQCIVGDFEVSRVMGTPELAALTLLDWFKSRRVRNLVMAAIESLDHPLRYRVDVFLMHTCLVDFIVDQNKRGLTVDLPEAVQVYLRLWSHRPMSDRMAAALGRLVWNRNSRRLCCGATSCWFSPRFLIVPELHQHVRRLQACRGCRKPVPLWQCRHLLSWRRSLRLCLLRRRHLLCHLLVRSLPPRPTQTMIPCEAFREFGSRLGSGPALAGCFLCDHCRSVSCTDAVLSVVLGTLSYRRQPRVGLPSPCGSGHVDDICAGGLCT